MKTPEEIRKQIWALRAKLYKITSEIELEIEALRAVCTHDNVEVTQYSCPDKQTWKEFNCPDCGEKWEEEIKND